MNPFSVVFIDLQGSSAAPAKRADLQQQLLTLRDRLNTTYAASMTAAFQVVWGDELKGILRDPRQLWSMYQQTHRLLEGTSFRCAIGFGSIDTPFSPGGSVDINLLDGTAFKAARIAMDELKARPASPYQARFHTAGNKQYAAALNAYVDVLNDIVKHMTPAQLRYFQAEYPWHLSRHSSGDAKPGEQTSRQAAWETLQRARIDAYRSAVAGLNALLALGADTPGLLLPGGDCA